MDETTPYLPAAPRDVSAVIVTFWTGPLLERCIASLLTQDRLKDIILVDNGNPPKDMERAVAMATDAVPIRLISGHGNIGFARACNLGADAADGTYLLFLNPDATLPANGLDRLLAEGAALERPWVLGGKLVNPDGTEQAGSRRRTLTPWRAFVEMTRLDKFAPRHPYFRRFNCNEDPCPGKTCATPVISGASMLLHKEDYALIGGMDEAYFLHVEDVDFCLRFREAGGGVYYTPLAEIVHHKSSSRANPIRVEYLKAKSLVRYFWTHYRKPYPSVFLLLVSAAVWAGFGVRAAKRAVRRALGLVGFAGRHRGAGLKRAQRLSSRASNRR